MNAMIVEVIQKDAVNLINKARMNGVVLEIQVVPCLPLEMGNYKMVAHARAMRNPHCRECAGTGELVYDGDVTGLCYVCNGNGMPA